MTLDELVALSRQLLWVIFESGLLKLSDLPALADLMKAISVSDAEISSQNSRLAEIETRLSTLELGLLRHVGSLLTTGRPEDLLLAVNLQQSLLSRTRESRSGKPS